MADNNVMDEIQTINGISLCDKSLREKIELVISEIERLENLGHNHDDEYISREEMASMFVDKVYVANEIDRFKNTFVLSDYITKTELNNKKYLSQNYADINYATKSYADAKMSSLLIYIQEKLKELATLQRLEEIQALLNNLDIKLKKLEDNLPNLEQELDNAINKEYKITTKFTGEIELSNSATAIKAGSEYSTQIASTGSNYEFNSIKISMGGVDITNSVLTSVSTLRKQITIPKVTGDIVITASTKVSGYYITSNIPNCSTNNNATWVKADNSYSAQITANTHYKIKSVTVTMGGTDITSQCYTKISDENIKLNILKVTGNVTITVTAELKTYTITYYTTNCSKTNSSTSIKAGKSYYVQIVANLNYTIANATVTMGGVNVNNQYLSNTSTGGVEIDIESVTGNIVITVEATLDRYNISRSLTNCSASNSTTSIAAGSAYYCVITPTTNYEINQYQLTMGGVNVTSQYANKSGTKLIINIPSITGAVVISANAVQTYYPCTSITCNSTMTIALNATNNLGVKVSPSNCSDSVWWDISDTSAISVYKEGSTYYAHAVKAGSYTVTLHCGSKSCTCKITVPEPAVYYNISYYLVGGVASDSRQTIEKGKSYYTVITTTQSNLHFISASVTMGGSNVSQYVTMTNTQVIVNIPSVTGHIVIDARTSDGWPITYLDNGNVSYSNKQTSAAHKSLFETYIYFSSTLDYFLANFRVTVGSDDLTYRCITETSNGYVFISISQVTGPVVISAYC